MIWKDHVLCTWMPPRVRVELRGQLLAIVLAFLLAEVVSLWFLLLGCVFHAVWPKCFLLTLLCPV